MTAGPLFNVTLSKGNKRNTRSLLSSAGGAANAAVPQISQKPQTCNHIVVQI